MVVTDPIADFLTRIRNALSARHDSVDIPMSKMKESLARILAEEGFIKSYEVIPGEVQGTIRIQLKYGPKNEKVVNNLKRISKPGLRVYCGAEDLPKVLGGLGIAIVSTSKGVMTDKKARAQDIGGEVLAYVW